MIKIIEDQEEEKKIRQAIADNDGYCPCKLIKLPENKCMCKDFKEQKEGWCHCGLYFKETI
jgi:hypothetical protein